MSSMLERGERVIRLLLSTTILFLILCAPTLADTGANFGYLEFLYTKEGRASDFDTNLYWRGKATSRLDFIRFPAGCSADLYDWQNPRGISPEQVIAWANDHHLYITWIVNIQGDFPHIVCGQPAHDYWFWHEGILQEAYEFAQSYPQIKVYEIANEPWAGYQNTSIEVFRERAYQYGLVAKQYTQAIKQANPQAEVYIGARTAWGTDKAQAWYEGIEASGALEIADGVYDHIYCWGAIDEFWDEVYEPRIRLLKELYPDKKIYISEWNLWGWDGQPHPAIGTDMHTAFVQEMVRRLEKDVALNAFHALHSVGEESGLVVSYGNEFHLGKAWYGLSRRRWQILLPMVWK